MSAVPFLPTYAFDPPAELSEEQLQAKLEAEQQAFLEILPFENEKTLVQVDHNRKYLRIHRQPEIYSYPLEISDRGRKA